MVVVVVVVVVLLAATAAAVADAYDVDAVATVTVTDVATVVTVDDTVVTTGVESELRLLDVVIIVITVVVEFNLLLFAFCIPSSNSAVNPPAVIQVPISDKSKIINLFLMELFSFLTGSFSNAFSMIVEFRDSALARGYRLLSVIIC